MIRTQTQTWWLLALCGVLQLASAAMNLLMLNLDGSFALRKFGTATEVRDMSVLAVAAGACVIAAGLWNSGRDNSWLLSLHGLGLATFGLIGLSPLVRGPLSFRPVSLLFVLMAVSIGAFAVRRAQTLRRGLTERSLFAVVGVVSICFALSFILVGSNFIKLGAAYSFWMWMSSYFAFCAIVMLWLARLLKVPNAPRTAFL